MPTLPFNKLLPLCAGAIALMLHAGHAGATPITGLYGTGVNDSGVVRATNTGLVDLHYGVASPYYTLKDANWGSPWLANSTQAGWVAPFYAGTNSWSYDAGHYIISTLFTIAAGEDAASAGFTTRVASDNAVTVSLNGHVLGNGGPLNAFATLSASDHFVSGTNTLSFDVFNAYCGSGCQNPAGLIVEITESHVRPLSQPVQGVPEPASLALASLALLACLGSRVRAAQGRG